MKSKDAISREPENTPRQESTQLDASWQEKLQSRRVVRVIPQLADRCSPPLSFVQERLWLLDQLEPGSVAYNRPLALRLTGLLDESALRQALQTIVDRHEVLRTRFTTRDGQPAQVISPSLALDLRDIYLCKLASAERESHASGLATEEALRPFDLTRDPVFRAKLLRLGEQDHLLLLVFHHIAFDAWSARVFLDEFAVLYGALSTGSSPALADLPIQYLDFAHWQRQRLGGELLERQLAYWQDQLRGCVAVDLPADRPRPSVQSHRGGSVNILLPAPLAESLKSLSRSENATLFMTLLAAFQVLLARYTGSEDITVGSPVAGRNWVETEKLIGIFINLLVLRTNLSGSPTFRELLGRVRETCRGAYSHQDLPFEKLVEALRPERDLSTTPLFQVMFNLENLPEFGSEFPGLRVEDFEFEWPVATYDLTLEIVPADRQLKCFFEYNTDLFDHGTMERMAGHYRTLLEGIVAEPDEQVAVLPFLTAAERHQILVEWNRTRAEYPLDATIQRLFEAQVGRTPGTSAFIGENGEITYHELNHRANQVARCLRAIGVTPESFVGVCLDRSLEAVVSLLGILKAGAAFVPLDPASPPERLAFMIADTRMPIVLSRQKWSPILPPNGIRIFCLDSGRNLIEAQSGENLPSETRPESVAYVLYTSGSTGTPKGVLGLHRGAINRFAWMWKNFPFAADEICCQKTMLSFVDCIWEIFGPLLQGVPNVIIPDRAVRDPEALIRTLAFHRVTRIVTVPSLLRVILERYADLGVRLPSLKLWVSSGEALMPDLCRRFRSAMPHATLLNLYGSTEVSADVTTHITGSAPAEQWTVPLGRPIANTQIYVLDQNLQPVPIGVAGELCIGGDGLARGYLNQPEITAQKFIPHPFSTEQGALLYRSGDLARYLPDGNIEFLGRLDDQVKIRGFRIELGEIEAALTEHPEVKAAAVVVREESPGERHLAAYVVPRRSTALANSKALRGFLKQKLPDPMVPSDYIPLEALPLTPSGKIDRRALPFEGRQSRVEEHYVGPRDVLEWQLVEIWEKLLNVHPIGIQHDFFDLGGHSLLAACMMDRIEDACGRRLPLSTLFAEATIEHLGECLRAEKTKESQTVIETIQASGSYPPLFFLYENFSAGLRYRRLAQLLGQAQPFYGVMLNGFNGKPLLPTVEAMAEQNIRHLLAFQPSGPYLLGGFCSWGHVAYEMARQMRLKGLKVNLVILIDSWVPKQMKWIQALIWSYAFLAILDQDAQSYWYIRIRNFLLDCRAASKKGVGDLSIFLREKMKNLLQEIPASQKFRSKKNTGSPSTARGASLSERHLKIVNAYKPKPYDGHVVLFRSRWLQAKSPTDPTAGWGSVASKMDVHWLACEHNAILGEHAGIVAEHLRSYLGAFQGEGQHTQTHLGPT